MVIESMEGSVRFEVQIELVRVSTFRAFHLGLFKVPNRQAHRRPYHSGDALQWKIIFRSARIIRSIAQRVKLKRNFTAGTLVADETAGEAADERFHFIYSFFFMHFKHFKHFTLSRERLARISPEHKRRFADSLHKSGRAFGFPIGRQLPKSKSLKSIP